MKNYRVGLEKTLNDVQYGRCGVFTDEDMFEFGIELEKMEDNEDVLTDIIIEQGKENLYDIDDGKMYFKVDYKCLEALIAAVEKMNE